MRNRSFNIRTNYMVNREMTVVYLGKADEGSQRLPGEKACLAEKAELISC